MERKIRSLDEALSMTIIANGSSLPDDKLITALTS